MFCSQTFGSASAKDDHILDHFAQETCMECDRKLLRIGNNLYTIHTPLNCVKEQNHCRSIGPITSDVKQRENDLWQSDNNSIKLESERTLAECEIKIEVEPIPFDESYESNDMPAASSSAQRTATVDALEMDDLNMEAEADASNGVSNRSFGGHDTGAPSSSNQTVYHTKCGICRELFRNEIELGTHMKKVHIKSNGSLQCDICLRNVKTENGLHIHKRYVHDEAGIWKFNCKACNAIFTQESSLQTHQCGDKLKCEFCDKSGFANGFALKSHVAFKHKHGRDTVNHVCKLCTRTFESVEKRDEHRTLCSYRRNIRVSKICGELWCDVCLCKFDNNSLLRKHIQSMHSDCQKFDCDKCCALFMKKSSYDNHYCTNLSLRTKKKMERVSCEVCKRQLCNRTALQKHIVFFHSKPGTLFCTLCAQIFDSQKEHSVHRASCQLKRKMLRYKRHECNLCDFIAKTQISLRKHITEYHKATI